MCTTLMPPGKMLAHRKLLNPSMGRVRSLIARWPCSMMSFKNFVSRISIGVSRQEVMPPSAARSAPLLSMLYVATSRTRAWLHASVHPTRLPHEWHKTMPDSFLVCGITGQIPGKEAFFVNEPPYQKWHHRGN
jgi:hypothetical protein